MQSKILKILFFALLGIVVLAGFFLYTNNYLTKFFAAGETATLNFNEVSKQVKTGEEFTASLLLTGRDVSSIELYLVYDPSILEYAKEYTSQSGFSQSTTAFGAPVVEEVSVINNAGALTVNQLRMTLVATSGQVTNAILNFKFRVKNQASGTSNIVVSSKTKIVGPDVSNIATYFVMNTNSPMAVTVIAPPTVTPFPPTFTPTPTPDVCKDATQKVQFNLEIPNGSFVNTDAYLYYVTVLPFQVNFETTLPNGIYTALMQCMGGQGCTYTNAFPASAGRISEGYRQAVKPLVTGTYQISTRFWWLNSGVTCSVTKTVSLAGVQNPIPTNTPVPTATLTPIPTSTSIPTPTNTPRPTATSVPTATPTPVDPCAKQPLGDANCNAVVDLDDYSCWLYGYLGKSKPLGCVSADFDKAEGVTILDFTIWKIQYLKELVTVKL